ncbi:MAG: phenylalanine--tRNA ligase subunit beta [Ignavibacteria bacterium]|nr:phenylalanine--tRNA ligase subunit beta [Ignavibacteria bacterium]
MRVSLNWLKNYIDISNYSPIDLKNILTNSGLEVEAIEEIGKSLEGFVVGEVISKEKHPNADKLSVCKVNDGKEIYQVICGAPNVEAGQKIVFAPLGVIIPGTGEKLKKAKIRGVESFGMICSEMELGLGDDHTGIVVLDNNAPIGMPINEYLGLNDYVLEIGITPNRPDALSHVGIARELSALTKKKFVFPKIDFDEVEDRIEKYLKVEIENEIDCPRYCARMVRNVKVKESPQWLKNYLTNVGIRPINNIVDVSNFVMLELGQPLHTFDARLIEGGKIIVKNADENEKFVTLDGKERILDSSMLMICDAVKKIAIAGVMGGANSEISENTKDVIIESAYFNPKSIRRTSKKLGLSTESSYRFERGVDYKNTLVAANRAAQLIAELAGGEIIGGYIDENPVKFDDVEVELRVSRTNKILGIELTRDEIVDILQRLNIQVQKSNGDILICTIPSFRPDLTREIDLIEEVARIYGYDKIPGDSRINFEISIEKIQPRLEDKIREILTGYGLYEVMNNTLLSEDEAHFDNLKSVKILNPISQELSHLRTSLIPGLLKTVSLNHRFSEFDLQLYEIGRVMIAKKENVVGVDDYVELEKLGICLTGKLIDKNWKENAIVSDIFYLKGIVEALLEKLSLDNINFTSYYASENAFYSIEIKVFIGKTYIGSLYKMTEDYLKKFDIEKPVYIAEFDLGLLKTLPKSSIVFKKLSNYPKVERDISFFVDNDIAYEKIEKVIWSAADRLLVNVYLFDLYFDPKKSDKKSLAIRLEFQSYEKTLTAEEVEARVNKITSSLEKELNIQLRKLN